MDWEQKYKYSVMKKNAGEWTIDGQSKPWNALPQNTIASCVCVCGGAVLAPKKMPDQKQWGDKVGWAGVGDTGTRMENLIFINFNAAVWLEKKNISTAKLSLRTFHPKVEIK